MLTTLSSRFQDAEAARKAVSALRSGGVIFNISSLSETRNGAGTDIFSTSNNLFPFEYVASNQLGFTTELVFPAVTGSRGGNLTGARDSVTLIIAVRPNQAGQAEQILRDSLAANISVRGGIDR